MKKSGQEDLFNIREARAARDEAVEQIARTASPDFTAYMLDRVVDVARSMPELTTDDVIKLGHDRGDMPPVHDRRALGPVMTAARRLGLIRNTGRTKQCTRRARHAGWLTIWKSLIYRHRA